MGIPRSVVETVLERDEWWCQIAGPNCLRAATVADHRANRGAGGSKSLNVPQALIAACGSCNGDKESASGVWRADLERRGVIVLKAATNKETVSRCLNTPFIDPWGSMWLLLANGSRQLVEEPPF